jgi:hypothetical protein
MTKLVVGTAAIGVCLATLACERTPQMPMQPTALSGGATALESATAASPGGVVDAGQTVIDLAALPAIVPVGSSRLVRTPNGVNFTLSTTGLGGGHAYTLWIVIFNNPAGCGVPHECGPDDVVNDAAKPDMMYAAGSLATAAGTATFAGRQGVGGRNGSINAPVGLPAYGLMDPYGAEIHLAVHDHGPKLPEFLPDMIQTVDGGCTDAGIPVAGVSSPWNDYPGFGRRGPNTCATVQAAVHRP